MTDNADRKKYNGRPSAADLSAGFRKLKAYYDRFPERLEIDRLLWKYSFHQLDRTIRQQDNGR